LLSMRRKNLGKMHGLDGQARAIDYALELHQAARIDGDHRGCPGLLDGLDLGASHRARHLGKLHRKRSAESAAFLRRRHLGEREAAHVGQQSSRSALDPQLAQRVAAIVIRHHAIEARPDIVHLGNFEQESRKLPDARLQWPHLGKHFGIVLEQIGEMMPDHRRAGARRHDDVLGVAKNFEKMPGDLARLIGVAGVERGLAATGLGYAKLDFVAQALQHCGDRDANLREDLIDDAGDEQRDARAQSGSLTHARTYKATC